MPDIGKKTVVRLNEVRERNEKAVDELLARVGLQIAHLEESALLSIGLGEESKQILSAESHSATMERTIERWNELGEELDAIDQIEFDIESRREELAPHLDTIGAAAFEAYSGDTDVHESLADEMGTITALDGEIGQREAEIRSIETAGADGSIFGRTVAKGRTMVLRSALKGKLGQRARAFRDLGSRVCSLDAEEDSTAIRLVDALVPVREPLDEIKRLTRQQSQLEADREQVTAKRTEIEEQENNRNPIKGLEHEVRRLRSEIDERSKALGTTFLADKSHLDADDEVARSEKEIDRLRAENGVLTKLIGRVEATIDLDRLTPTIDSKERERGRHLADIAAIDRELEDLGNRKSALMKARGSQSKLETELARHLGPEHGSES